MCLLIWKFSRKKIAKEDIKCFKVLKRRNGRLLSPYMDDVYKIGELKIAEIGEPETVGILFLASIVEEGLHTFTKFDDVFDWEISEGESWSWDTAIYHAVIPKGSEYYIGTFQGYKGYVSNQLIVTGECPFTFK